MITDLKYRHTFCLVILLQEMALTLVWIFGSCINLDSFACVHRAPYSVRAQCKIYSAKIKANILFGLSATFAAGADVNIGLVSGNNIYINLDL